MADVVNTMEWASLGSTIINVGFAGFVGWYLLTKALPKMLDDFRQTLRDQQNSYQVLDEGRRQDFKDSLDTVLKHANLESLRRDDNVKSEMAIINMSIKDTREVLEEVRDALRATETRRQKKPISS